MKKQFIAKLLVFALVLGLLPFAAFAAEPGDKWTISGKTATIADTCEISAYTIPADVKTIALGTHTLTLTNVTAAADLTFTTSGLSANPAQANLTITGGEYKDVYLGNYVYAVVSDASVAAHWYLKSDADSAKVQLWEGDEKQTLSKKPSPPSGGSTTTTTKPAETTKGDDVKVSGGKVTTKADGTVSKTFTDSEIKKAVDKATTTQADNIVLEMTATELGSATVVEQPLSAASLKTIADAGKGVVFANPIATTTLNNTALKSLSGDVVVKAEKDAEAGTVKISITAGGQAVGAISGVKAALPVTDEQATSKSTVVVLVNADGTETIIKKSALDGDGNIAAMLKSGECTLKVKDNEKTFDDAPTQDWAKDAVAFAASHELFKGTSANTFAPNAPMNRAMLVTVLYRLEDASHTGGAAFGDVAEGTWYTDAVGWAVNAGITNGAGSGFAPTKAITRQDLATMLYRYAKTIDMDVTTTGSVESFSDADSVASYAADAMKWAVGMNIINGTDGALNPKDNATRAQVAAMTMRLIEKM